MGELEDEGKGWTDLTIGLKLQQLKSFIKERLPQNLELSTINFYYSTTIPHSIVCDINL